MSRLYQAASTLATCRVVSPNNESEMSSCIKALASAFKAVPCTNAFSLESGQSIHDYVNKSIRASIRCGGAVVEAGHTSAVALWELPYQRGGTFPSNFVRREANMPRPKELTPIKQEWKDMVRRAKEKYIGMEASNHIRPHYHLDFLGRNPHVPRVPGAISAVVTPFLERAEQEKLDAWLEATSEDVVRIYEHFGFRVMEEIQVGVGKVNGEGKAQRGGGGVKAWLMLIDNKSKV